MQITIAYDSSWRNSFLDGDNNEPLPKRGRKYKAALSNLNPKQKSKESTYDYKSVSHDTVMGVLNRLIGDQRKLYQSRDDKSYIFRKTEEEITFCDYSEETQEITYLRNMSGSFDQNSFVGSIKLNQPLISSVFSPALWGVLKLELPKLYEFILDEEVKAPTMEDIDPFLIIETIKGFKNINSNKIENSEDLNCVIEKLNNDLVLSQELKNMYPKMKKSFNEGVYLKGDLVQVGSLYCSALYIQVLRLSKTYDMSEIILKGISVNNITPKNFLELFTGGQKRVWGNPYIHENYVKGKGKTRSLMTKASGKLEIYLDISKERAKEIRLMIRDAGVSSFYLGKKGLAYVEDIKITEVKK